jgi:hypothetical protein
MDDDDVAETSAANGATGLRSRRTVLALAGVAAVSLTGGVFIGSTVLASEPDADDSRVRAQKFLNYRNGDLATALTEATAEALETRDWRMSRHIAQWYLNAGLPISAGPYWESAVKVPRDTPFNEWAVEYGDSENPNGLLDVVSVLSGSSRNDVATKWFTAVASLRLAREFGVGSYAEFAIGPLQTQDSLSLAQRLLEEVVDQEPAVRADLAETYYEQFLSLASVELNTDSWQHVSSTGVGQQLEHFANRALSTAWRAEQEGRPDARLHLASIASKLSRAVPEHSGLRKTAIDTWGSFAQRPDTNRRNFSEPYPFYLSGLDQDRRPWDPALALRYAQHQIAMIHADSGAPGAHRSAVDAMRKGGPLDTRFRDASRFTVTEMLAASNEGGRIDIALAQEASACHKTIVEESARDMVGLPMDFPNSETVDDFVKQLETKSAKPWGQFVIDRSLVGVTPPFN